MADRVREQLLGYLIEALEEPEQERVAKQLEQDPALRRKLARLRKSLRALGSSRHEFAPPAGLAARTCRLVARCRDEQQSRERPAPASVPLARVEVPAMSAVPAPPIAAAHWSWADAAVAAGIFVAASLLLLPAIANSRFNAQVAACRNNLQQIGLALAQYSDRHQGYFPQVSPRGQLAGAGVYAPTMIDHGFLADAQRVICPGSPLASDRQFRIPSLKEVLRAGSAEESKRLRGMMGGSYGYCLGYMEGGRYHDTRNLRRPHFALVVDAPSATMPGYQSVNHGGLGQNVLFEDGRVAFCRSSRADGRIDDFFVNDLGLVTAGSHRDDAVIGASSDVPALFVGLELP
jgi:hypothetical protein